MTNTASTEGELRRGIVRQIILARVPGFKQTKGELHDEMDLLPDVYVDNIMQLFDRYAATMAREERRLGEYNMLQWVENLGKEATKYDSVHDMDEYNRHYGEAVSFPVHNKLVDKYGDIVALASPDPDAISLCPWCNCITHTVSKEFEQQCGKCGRDKTASPDGEMKGKSE